MQSTKTKDAKRRNDIHQQLAIKGQTITSTAINQAHLTAGRPQRHKLGNVMGASKESMHAAMENRIERIKALQDYQSGNILTIEHTCNRMRGDSSPETIAQTLREMEDRGLLTAGILVRGNARIRTYVRRSQGLRMKWRTVSNQALGIKENCGIQGAYP